MIRSGLVKSGQLGGVVFGNIVGHMNLQSTRVGISTVHMRRSLIITK